MAKKDDRSQEELDALEQALQLPSFGRRRRGRKAAPAPVVEPVETPLPAPAAEPVETPSPEPAVEPAETPPVVEPAETPPAVEPVETPSPEPAVEPVETPSPSPVSPAAERAALAKAALAGVRERAGAAGGTLSERLAARRRGGRPAVAEPVETAPLVEPADTPPLVEPADTPPLVEPADTPPQVEPVETPPVVEPVETPPVVEPVETPAVAEPVETPPAEPEVAPVAPVPQAQDATPPPAVPEEPVEKRPSRAAALLGRVRGLDLPPVPETAAVVVSGVVAGVVLVLLGGLSLQICSVVQGSGSCGRPVIPMLVAAFVAAIVVGARLLRAWEVGDPGSTSFLALSLAAVVIILFLLGSLFSWAMAVIVPVVSAAMFLLSHFLTTKLSEGAEDVHPPGR